jgi:hypothetical protein
MAAGGIPPGGGHERDPGVYDDGAAGPGGGCTGSGIVIGGGGALP